MWNQEDCFETLQIGRVRVLLNTLNDEYRVCAYVPVNDKLFPDGKLLVGGSSMRMLGTTDNYKAKLLALQLVTTAMLEQEIPE